ncbi:Substrate-specific component BioY of biotin ECF transporter [Paenibacillus pasadenensis]|uniref:Biotin transporter n=1 Tax=Paenibacillus pasadenensis TaxID=217090 RepID=A0A2N5N706_9BACL|nr:biotin transporter BioY [Paenibacillus pasadenensis]PLT46112.1 Substrate-specific component BioY of biotin ECF transporter [Paenibacillus pasadenensis]
MPTVSPLRRIVFIALFAALFVVFSAVQIQIGISPVPFTLQTMAVAIAGSFLGARDSFLSIALVYGLAATGLPLIRFQGGLSLFVGHTAGFLWVFPLCALLIGLIVPRLLVRLSGRSPVLTFLAVFAVLELLGSLLAYVVGIPWLMQATGLSFAEAMAAGCYPFLLPDLLKNVVAAGAAVALSAYLPSLRLLRAADRPDRPTAAA